MQSPSRWRLVGRLVFRLALGVVCVLAGLSWTVIPSAVLLHVASHPVTVKGTEPTGGGRGGYGCRGWVVPDGDPAPTPWFDGEYSMMGIPKEDRDKVYRVTVEGGSCRDGVFYTFGNSRHEVYSREVTFRDAGGMAAGALLLFMGGGALVGAWRTGRELREPADR